VAKLVRSIRPVAALVAVLFASAGGGTGASSAAEVNASADASPGSNTNRPAAEEWWSLRPLRKPAAPPLSGWAEQWARTPIDAFVAEELQVRGLKSSSEADRVTLARRLSFDLIGLPPTPERVRAFVQDSDPHAYERLVDELLASPHYGERWARHWLDIVHYGDSHGYDKDKPRPNAWPYRDYVIRAFNQDKPYHQFIEEQLAGDVQSPDCAEAIQATGFLAAGPWDLIGQLEVPETKVDGQIARHLDRDDMVATTMQTFLSTTAQCAQCHKHKFDPISQEDYYSLQADFAAIDRADRPYDDDPSIARRRRSLLNQQHALERELRRTREAVRSAAGPELEQLETRMAELRSVAKDQGERGDLQEELPTLEQAKDALFNQPSVTPLREQATRIETSVHDIEKELGKLPKPHIVFAGTVVYGSGNFVGTGPDGGKPRTIHVLSRGDVRKPKSEVGPGALGCVTALPARFEVSPDDDEGQRRLALARWISDERNPLTWRSIVNRVWQYHFGHGLADTPNDFGRMGQKPSHPELLDWLAAEFRDGGQSLKQLHRLIVTSATYRQSSAERLEASALDTQNQFLWRMNRRQLEAEELRDAVLDVSGTFNPAMGGPGFQDFVIEKPEHSPHYRYDLYDPDEASSHRRSIYRWIIRSQPQPFMTTLDCADPSILVGKRNQTLTPIQALALLNDRFMLVMSKHFAERVAADGGDLPAQIDRACELALGHPARKEDCARLTDYAREFGLLNTCRMILNLNEFIFID
jgi:hypothetical protein